MSPLSTYNPRSPRAAISPGKLRSAHLAAIIGVKSLQVFRDFAADAAPDARNDKPPPPAPLPTVPFRVLWSGDKPKAYTPRRG